jgi:hypothetical protein
MNVPGGCGKYTEFCVRFGTCRKPVKKRQNFIQKNLPRTSKTLLCCDEISQPCL